MFLMVGIIIVIVLVYIPRFEQPSTEQICEQKVCKDWVYGSCTNKELYIEMECSCNGEIYYESELKEVEACSQSDCPEGRTFVKPKYRCI